MTVIILALVLQKKIQSLRGRGFGILVLEAADFLGLWKGESGSRVQDPGFFQNLRD